MIDCARSCDTHETRTVAVDLASPHAYGDYPPVPARLARSYEMFVFDPNAHPVDGGPYCPARDCVSETIVNCGIWEPVNTIAALDVLDGPAEGIVLDFGAQIGWFSLLGALAARPVLAYDADDAPMALLRESVHLNGLRNVSTFNIEFGEDARPFPTSLPHVRFVKIDVEGAESVVVAAIRPLLEAGRVDHALVEMSPSLTDDTDAALDAFIDAGYRPHQMPPKSTPPHPLTAASDLEAWAMTADEARGRLSWIDQEDWWFAREGASW